MSRGLRIRFIADAIGLGWAVTCGFVYVFDWWLNQDRQSAAAAVMMFLFSAWWVLCLRVDVQDWRWEKWEHQFDDHLPPE